ncbi:MAG: hypothetical protein AAB682_00790, partial [Patescibacteria group bacterium]
MNGEVFLQGKRYLSSRLASEIFGYTNDYIGQLIRGGKLEGQKMGRTWFVSEDSLNRHKVSVSMFSAKSETPATPSPVEPEEGETEVETEAEAELSQSKLSSAKYAVTIGVVLFFSASFFGVADAAFGMLQKVGGEVASYLATPTLEARAQLSASVSGEVGKFGAEIYSRITHIPESISALSKFVFSPWTGDRKNSVVKKEFTALGGSSSDAGLAALRAEIEKLRASGIAVTSSKVAPSVIEKIIPSNTIVYVKSESAQKVVGGVSEALLSTRLEQLNNKLVSEILRVQDSVLSKSSKGASDNYAFTALTNKIDQLRNVSLTDVRFSGDVTGVTDGMIPDDITVNSSKVLSITATATSTFAGGINLTSGCFSVLGNCNPSGSGTVVGGGSGSQVTFWLNANTLSGSNSFVFDSTTGYLGLGTTTPGTALSVSGNAVITGTTTVTAL